MTKPRVLFLTYWYPDQNKDNFGIFIKRHAKAIAMHVDVWVLSVKVKKENTFFKCTNTSFVDDAGIETHVLTLSSRFNKTLYLLLPLHYLFIKRYLRKYLMKNGTVNFTHVHSNVLFPCAIIGNKLARWLGLGHIISEHWSKIDRFFSVSLYRWAGRRALDSAQAITAVSTLLASTISKYTSNPNISVVPNVISSGDFFYDVNVKKYTEFTFVAVASWTKSKNPFYFLNALQSLWQEKSIGVFKLIMIGEGPLLAEIQEKNYGFPILFPGTLNPELIRQELNRSHAFLHGSDYETFSVIIIEALMCGLPVVVSPVGIAPDVIDGENGLITPNTLEDWKKNILRIYQSQYDYKAISGSVGSQFDVNTVSDYFKKVYDRD